MLHSWYMTAFRFLLHKISFACLNEMDKQFLCDQIYNLILKESERHQFLYPSEHKEVFKVQKVSISLLRIIR